jgi:F0F1-type ATP synthase assembly protein I
VAYTSAMRLLCYDHTAEEETLELESFQKCRQISPDPSRLELTVVVSDSHSMLGSTPVTAEPVGSTTSLVQPPSHSSSSSSISQRYRGTETLRGRIGSLLLVPFVVVANWKQESRFDGWQWGVLTGSAIGGLVLLINCLFVMIGATSRSGYNEGIATIFTGRADKVSLISMLLYIAINVLKTLLLSASNYTMQVLSAPTRNECVQTHREGHWLEIGILSMRNIRSLTSWKKVLWLTLSLSSVPLHLLCVKNLSAFDKIDRI